MSGPQDELVTPAVLRAWPLAQPGVGKESRGTIVVVGGSVTTPGAVHLAGEAALRAGAGKLLIATARSVAGPLAVAVPEARVLRLAEDQDGSIGVGAATTIIEVTEGVDALLIGPGFVDPEASVRLLDVVLPKVSCPVLLDGPGTAYLTEHPAGLKHLADSALVTANLHEVARMLQQDPDDVAEHALDAARELADRTGVVILAGGAAKHIAAPGGRSWTIEGGGPGLGVSGSGDVQAGIAAGLLARGEDPAKSAVWAGYLHARAGEHLAGAVGRVGYLARELPATVPRLIAELG